MSHRIKYIMIRLFLLSMIVLTGWVLVSAVGRTMKSRSETIQYKIKGSETNNAMVTEDDLKVILDKEFNAILVGAPISDVDIQAIEKRMEKEELIQSVQVYLDANNQLHIEVEPMIAALRIMDDKGRNYYLDPTGVRFPVSKHYTPRVPVVTGQLPVYEKPVLEEKEGNILKEVFELSSLLRNDEFLSALIEQIHVDENNKIILVPKVGDHVIKYGRHNEDGVERLDNLKVFYKEGMPYEGWNKYEAISIEYKGQVVCTHKE
jgi:cell division protein FtsQ